MSALLFCARSITAKAVRPAAALTFVVACVCSVARIGSWS